jgi:hypothetical protein
MHLVHGPICPKSSPYDLPLNRIKAINGGKTMTEPPELRYGHFSS